MVFPAHTFGYTFIHSDYVAGHTLLAVTGVSRDDRQKQATNFFFRVSFSNTLHYEDTPIQI